VRLEVTLVERRARVARVRGVAYVGGQVVAEAVLVLACQGSRPRSTRRPSSTRTPDREGTVVGPYVVIGPHVSIGRRCRIGASSVIDGWTEIGDDNVVCPFASIGCRPRT